MNVLRLGSPDFNGRLPSRETRFSGLGVWFQSASADFRRCQAVDSPTVPLRHLNRLHGCDAVRRMIRGGEEASERLAALTAVRQHVLNETV